MKPLWRWPFGILAVALAPYLAVALLSTIARASGFGRAPLWAMLLLAAAASTVAGVALPIRNLPLRLVVALLGAAILWAAVLYVALIFSCLFWGDCL